MKNSFMGYLFLLIYAMSLLSSCGDDDNDCIDGTGPFATETRTVDDFHSVNFDGVGTILLTQGTPQSLRIESNQEIIDIFDTEVMNEELLIDMKGNQCISGKVERIDIYITIPEIKNLSLEGVGNITAQNNFNIDDLDIALMGVGNIILQGSVDNLTINSSGVGNIQAFDMNATNCEIRLTGVGNIQVNVSDDLDVTISGSGNVSYKGNPTISVDITGSGSLNNAN